MRHPVLLTSVALLLSTTIACSSGEEGDFTRLIRTGGPERYDLAVENMTDIRAAELPPGAASNAPVIDGDQAARKVHFITTYSAEVTAREIGMLVEEGMMEARFLMAAKISSEEKEGSYTSTIEYTFPGGSGVLHLDLRERDDPRTLDFRYELTEKLE